MTSFFQRTAPELVEHVELYEGKRAAVRADGRRGGVPIGALPPRRPALGRLPDDRLRRGADGDRRQHRAASPAAARAGWRTRSRKVNVEAAEEVVRQLRLRDIGGIIVIDFIDMARARNRDQVLKTLRKALDADKTKSYVMEVSPLGLVEMTRQNVTDGVREILTKRCPTCDGEGVVESEETVAIERRPRACASWSTSSPEPGGLPGPGQPEGRRRAAARGQPAARARGGVGQALPLRGRRRAAARHLRGGRRGHPGRDRGARAAVPGRRRGPGARSRSRTCTTSTTRSRGSTPTSSASPAAGRFVGERRLVRIESVGRSAATASLVGGAEEDNGNGADDAEGGAPTATP